MEVAAVMGDIERTISRHECPVEGCPSCTTLSGHHHAEDCHMPVRVPVEYVRADQLQGAVERAERAEALAVRLYRLMGEEAERVFPGELESSELLRDHFGER